MHYPNSRPYTAFFWFYNSDSTKASNQAPRHLFDLQRPVAKFRPSLDQNCPPRYRSLSVLQSFQNHQKRNQFHHFHKVQRILVQQTIQYHLVRFWIHLESSKYHKESKIKLHMAVTHFQRVSIICSLDLSIWNRHWLTEESLSNYYLGEIPPQSMATTIDDGLSSGREGLSDGEIKPQKLKRMKNHLGLAL